MKSILISFLVFCGFLGFAQQIQKYPCGTKISPDHSRSLQAAISEEAKKAALRQMEDEVKEIAVVAHLIRKDDGSGGITFMQVHDEIAALNRLFVNSKLSFYIVTINEIPSSEHFNFRMENEELLAAPHDVENAINVYFVNNIRNHDEAYICGYSYPPVADHPDRIIIDNRCATKRNTLSHEIGHFFSLLHTHGTDDAAITNELVDGSNCDTAGDQVCDTPADPKLGVGNVNDACVYVGEAVDKNGDPFHPDPSNIMSYSLESCRENLTDQQYERIRLGYEAFRTYLSGEPNRRDVSILGADEQRALSDIRIVPNPVVDAFSIEVPQSLKHLITSVTVLNFSGSEVYRTQQLSMQARFSSGVYLVRIAGEGFETTRRIIVKD